MGTDPFGNIPHLVLLAGFESRERAIHTSLILTTHKEDVEEKEAHDRSRLPLNLGEQGVGLFHLA